MCYIGCSRDGKMTDRQVKLGEMEEKAEVAKAPSTHKRLGIMVQNVTPEIAQGLGLKKETGVVVTEIEPGSPASDAGIQTGDVIREVNRKPVKDVEDFVQKIGHMPEHLIPDVGMIAESMKEPWLDEHHRQGGIETASFSEFAFQNRMDLEEIQQTCQWILNRKVLHPFIAEAILHTKGNLDAQLFQKIGPGVRMVTVGIEASEQKTAK